MAFWNKKNKREETKKVVEEKPIEINEDMNDDNSNSSFKTKNTKSNTKNDKLTSTRSLGRNIYYVSARKDKSGKKIGWEVKKENAAKVTRIVNTKEEALEIVKELAGHNESTVIIRKVDGSIQETIKFKSK